MLLAQELYCKTSLIDTLALFGGLTVAVCLLKFTWKCWCGLRRFVLSEQWQVDLRAYGQWAVVTGATSGIGRAYATELARRGLDVVLLGRSDNKLQMVAREIKNEYGRKTHTIQVDFTEGGSIYSSIAKELQGLQIGILVLLSSQCVAPLMVSTNMTHNMQVNCLVKSASAFAYEAVNTVGHSSYTSGCLSHALQVRTEQ
ncbi:hypothetical protein XENORESO_020633 [Xenotaenia resolanae]|uniref:Uncharacterized protein n=1 Tax=Xenotaenia resolanae TaxID=208358 RepID=A0ABV0WGZ8_9TELE